MILLAYLEVAQCTGVEHPKALPPAIVYVPVQKVRCSFGRCSGKYFPPPRRKIKIAMRQASSSLLKHEFVHDLLEQRDGDPDHRHRDPAFANCVR